MMTQASPLCSIYIVAVWGHITPPHSFKIFYFTVATPEDQRPIPSRVCIIDKTVAQKLTKLVEPQAQLHSVLKGNVYTKLEAILEDVHIKDVHIKLVPEVSSIVPRGDARMKNHL